MIPSMFRKAMVGDGSTLNLDFTTMTATADLTARGLTFTRGSNGTRINASGFVETMSNNVARFDHDPSTRAPRGLLVEGTSTNLCEQGQYCWGSGTTQSWGRNQQVHVNSVNGASGGNNVPRIDGPDGGSLTGTSLFKDSGSNTFVRTFIALTVSASTTYTFSVYVRAPSGGNPYMRLAAFNGGTWLNTTGGTTASGITITDTVGGGSKFNGVPSTAWVRIWVTFTTQVGQTSATIAFYPDTDTQNAATMYVWGAQVEVGSGPSSVILTGVSTATREQDQMEMADISALSYNLSVGTVAITAFWNKNASSAFPRSIRFVNASNVISSAIITTTDDLLGNWPLANGTTTLETTSANVPPLARFKYAMSASAVANPTLATLDVALNGTTGNTTGVASTVRPATKLQFLYGAVAATDYPSMTISSLKYWPTLMTSAQLQAMTTL